MIFDLVVRSCVSWIFRFFQNPSRMPFLEALSANLCTKVRFWSHFGISGGPKIRRHRPVSGVVDKRGQHQRSAAFGGFPSLPPGVLSNTDAFDLRFYHFSCCPHFLPASRLQSRCVKWLASEGVQRCCPSTTTSFGRAF